MSRFVRRQRQGERRRGGRPGPNPLPRRVRDRHGRDVGSSSTSPGWRWTSRAPGRTCPPGSGGRTVPAAPLYFVYAVFTGPNEASSKVMFTRSLRLRTDLGPPPDPERGNSLNNGAVVAVDPVSGTVHVAWRRFAAYGQDDAILAVRAADAGTAASSACPPGWPASSPTTRVPRPRASGPRVLPTIAVSVNPDGTRAGSTWPGRSVRRRAHDSRVVLSTSADGTHWSAPAGGRRRAHH